MRRSGPTHAGVPPDSRHLRPTVVSRAAPAAVSVWLAHQLGWGDPLPGGWPVRVPVAAALVWLALRCTRLGVVVTHTSVEVRGYLWDRRVPRSAVVGVTGFPTLVWRSGSGRLRRTPVLSLVRNPRALPGIDADHRTRAAELRQLLGGRGRRKG
jgi:hypothetical protein